MKSDAPGRTVMAAAALALLVACAGCTSYQLGSTLPPGLESVYVPTVENRTGEPLLDSEVSRALLREFQRDGTLRVENEANASARLETTLVKFEMTPLRYERNDAKQTREYRVLITADIVLRSAKDNKVLVQRRTEGEATFDFLGDLASSKLTAVPKAATDLSHDIVEAIVEYW